MRWWFRRKTLFGAEPEPSPVRTVEAIRRLEVVTDRLEIVSSRLEERLGTRRNKEGAPQ